DVSLLIAYVSLISMAILPIFFGSFASLRTPKSVLKARKALKKAKASKNDKGQEEDEEDDDDDDDEPAASETLTSSDAWLFPVVGSCVLFSMYLVFKFLDRKWVDRILGSYFAFAGTGAVFKASLSIAAGVFGTRAWRSKLTYRLAITKRLSDEELQEEIRARDKANKETLLPVVTFYTTRHWMCSNVIALSLSLQAISLMGLDSFLTGSIMLGGLFVYDVFWVFGTEVMVSVARNFDAGPIKILFPKNLPDAATLFGHAFSTFRAAPQWQMTMLGLGDIVIPGIFVALSLRFDQHLYLSTLSDSKLATFTRRDASFPKPYFTATLTAYIVGLITTMAVMHTFQAAQPALLYLSPACVGAVTLKSLQRSEWKRVWAWQDEEEEKQVMIAKE
ncbi:peptidase A22B, signal peptide peptidase, partial [Microstroma glucosiphilum]